MYTLTPEDYLWFNQELAFRRERVYSALRDPRLIENLTLPHNRKAVLYYLEHPGKALRPMVLLLSCGILGGDEERAIPAGAAIEMFHMFTLVHDDIMDNDTLRRGRPTVHSAFAGYARDEWSIKAKEATDYGFAVALLAGDQQQGLAFGLLTDLVNHGVSPGLVLRLVRELALTLATGLTAGQLLDIQYSHRSISNVTEAELIDLIRRKTALLYGFAARSGALIGIDTAYQVDRSRSDIYVEALTGFAESSGIAFQLQDDLLDIVGEEAELGKPIGSDLREGKKTLLFHHALQHGTPRAVAELEGVLGNPSASSEEVAAVIQLLEEIGSLEYVRRVQQQYINAAYDHLAALPDTTYRKLLYLWSEFVINRKT